MIILAVMRWVSVPPSVRHVRILKLFYHHLVDPPFQFFRTNPCRNIPTGTHNWGKIAIFGQYLASGSITGGVECCQRISTVESVDNSKRRLRLCRSTGTHERTVQSLCERIGKSEVEVMNNKRLIVRSRYCTVETIYEQTQRAASLRQLSFLPEIRSKQRISLYRLSSNATNKSYRC